MKQEYKQLLKETLTDMDDTRRWLERSYGLCQKIGIQAQYSDDAFDVFENLTSRYARAVDYVIHKVFRNIDSVELETGGTMIDVINRAHKRNLFTDVDEVRRLKELRNEIAHDYSSRDLKHLFSDVMAALPLLLSIMDNVKAYCQKLL